MIRNRQIVPDVRMKGSFVKSAIVLCLVLLSANDVSFAQVISNTGSAISLSTGVVVGTKDIENSSGTLGNNGIINFDGYFLNRGMVNGNGFYNLKGDWTDYGSFNPDTSTVTLYGSSNQTIRNNSLGETFYNLIINNPGRVITQIANSGSTLGVLNDLNLNAGTLSLHTSTKNLSVGGKAAINGSLLFNGITTQAATIGGILSGPGTIDMSGGSLAHTLNLAGSENNIGTFTTSAGGASTVNYNGTDQTVFPAFNYRNLTISNSGVKTLQGNSLVGLNLNISGGTFDLGTVVTSLGVAGSSTITGSLSFNGTSAKTLSLAGNLGGTGAINMSGGNLPHQLNLNGSANSIGLYSSGTQSNVSYIRNSDQTVFVSDDYRNLTISGTGVKTLYGDVTAKGILTMSAGDINSNGNTLIVSNSAVGAIVRTSGIVIGKLQRAIGITGSDYLYPIGSSTVYYPLKISFNALTSGPLTAQFKPDDIGNLGLPLDDDGNEIYDRITTGYWSLTSVSPMESGSYNVNLNYNNFVGVDSSSSIIKRTGNNPIELDGAHGALTPSEITRDTLTKGIAATTTDFGIGIGRPRIYNQPDNIDICDGFDASFKVSALGRGALTYQWQVNTNDGSGFHDVADGGVYSGARTRELKLTGAPYSMNGYLYRCIITDKHGHPNTTREALLTVNKIPVAVATPSSQNVCTGVAFTDIALSTLNDVPGTSFAWNFTKPSGITTTLSTSGTTYDKISGTFNNTLNAPVTVTITIIPTGPLTTHCVGNPITVSVTVNPTPKVYVYPAAAIQCDSTTTSIKLTSPSTFTSGLISFRYTVSTTGSVTGFTSPTTGLPNNHYITDKLVNQTDTFQTVTYRVVPVSPLGCAAGDAKIATVTVNPTPRAVPVNIKPEICYDGATEIVLRSPTVMTSGSIIFDYTVSVTGGAGIVTGNTSSESDRLPEYQIKRQYTNDSDTLQSVYFAITPKVDNNICVPGNVFVSEAKVHPRPLQQLTVPKTLTCQGGSDATIRAWLAHGTSPFNVFWTGYFDFHREYTTSKDTTELENLFGGTYTVKVTDNLGCTNSLEQYISGAKLEENFTAVPKENGYGTTCPEPNALDGELSIREKIFSTGVAPFEYWVIYNNMDTVIHNIFATKNVYHRYYNLPSGRYTLYVRDANGCFNTAVEAEIVPPDLITVEFDKSQYAGGFNVSCKNASDGSAEVKSINGGSGGYKYQWSSADGAPLSVSSNTALLDSIPAGKYYLVTTDMYGCMKTDSVTLTEAPGMELVGSELSFSADRNTNISCNGGNDGYIKLTIAGGSGQYNYSWYSPTNGYKATTKDIFNLPAGTYVSTVIDENLCELKLMPGSVLPSFTLTEPSALVINSSASVSADGSYNINCNGGTGSIDIAVTGGSTGNYKYIWSTSDGSGIVEGQEDQFALTAGTYNLAVTDSNGCFISKDIVLTEPSALELQLAAKNITCMAPGNDNGSIDLSVSGGAAPYSYLWSNGAVSQDISGLTQGYYRVTVTYNNTCSKTDSALIELPPPITFADTLSDYNGFNISCNEVTDGSINITTTSGSAPFIFAWSGPDGFNATTEDISGIGAGGYTLLITDRFSCTATKTFDLKEPGRLGMVISLSMSTAGGFNINCKGDNTGSIGLEPLNQVKEVTYLWSDGIFGKTRMNLVAGEYEVVITDQNNCQASSLIVLTEPDSLKLAFEVTKPFCPDKPDGEIKLTATGGVPGTDYSYRWSDNSTTRNISDIAEGIYEVTVKDLNGCSIWDSVKVRALNETCLVIPNAISPNEDGINDVWNIDMIELYPEMEIKIFNRWGESIWRSEKGYPHPWDGRSNGARLPIDSYHYIIDLHNGSKPLVGNVTIVR